MIVSYRQLYFVHKLIVLLLYRPKHLIFPFHTLSILLDEVSFAKVLMRPVIDFYSEKLTIIRVHFLCRLILGFVFDFLIASLRVQYLLLFVSKQDRWLSLSDLTFKGFTFFCTSGRLYYALMTNKFIVLITRTLCLPRRKLFR